MKIIHIQTTVQAVFGVLDDNGDVISKQPVSIEISRLNQASFQEALDQLTIAKQNLEQKLPKEAN
jgi:hypothetical protein